MGLPGVNIEIQNGNLGGVPASADGICGKILTGITVAGVDKVTIGKAYGIYSLADAIALGIDAGGTNAYAYTHIKEFYDNAGDGSECWIMLVASTVTMEDMLDKTKLFAPVLRDAAQGKLKFIGVSKKSAGGVVVANGLDEDVDKAMIKGQEFALASDALFKPLRFIVDGKDFSGTAGDLKDYRTTSFNKGAVLLSATAAIKNACIGFALGKLASLPVQRKLSRVKNGALAISDAYLTDGSITESLETAWGAIHDKGYILFRTFANRSGYYFSSDTTATALTDDYSSLARGRVIDKASRIAYDVFVEEVDDEIEVGDDGNIDPGVIKALQQSIVTRIELQMAGEVTAVSAFIDPLQNVIATEELDIELSVTPYGYKGKLNIKLGLKNPATT